MPASQPVDLDYKGLSNAGTWFLGRLQTERDKARVLDGLEGASTAAGANFDRGRTEKILSGLGNRVFLMNNVHEDQPVVFQTRWALSFLRGPLTQEQIRVLMHDRRAAETASQTAAMPTDTRSAGGSPATTIEPARTTTPPAGSKSAAPATRPMLPPGVPEFFVPRRGSIREGALFYQPALLGMGKVHFAQTSLGVDQWETVSLLAPIDAEVGEHAWDDATVPDGEIELEKSPEADARFSDLPAALSRPKTYSEMESALKSFLYRARKLQLWRCAALKQTSQPGEAERDFRVRLTQGLREQRDQLVEKLRARYAPKLAGLQEQIRKAEQRVAKEQSQATHQTLQAAISMGTSILGAMFGRKLASSANVTRAASSVRQASKIAKERGDVGQANETVEAYKQRLADLEAEFNAEAEKAQTTLDPATMTLEEVQVQPKKSDIAISKVVLAWTPFRLRDDGTKEPLF